MPSINLRQLRDTRQIKAWLKAGKPIVLRERDKVIGRILPSSEETVPEDQLAKREWPDFEARQKAIFGDRVLNIVNDLIEDRGRY